MKKPAIHFTTFFVPEVCKNIRISYDIIKQAVNMTDKEDNHCINSGANNV